MARILIKETAIGVYSDYYLRLYLEETTDIVTNTSDVTISLYGYTERAIGNCAYNNFGKNSVSITVDGEESPLPNQNIDTRDWRTSGGYLLHSVTKSITHNGDGKKTIIVNGGIDYQGGGSSLNAGTYTTGDVSQELTPIPRASEVNMISGNTINNTTGNLVITLAKADPSLYDKVIYSGAFGTTDSIGTGNTSTISWGQILSLMTTTWRGTETVTVQTYTDDTYTTMIGESSTTLPITIDTTAIKPTFAFQTFVPYQDALSGRLVAGHSTARATWLSSATGGAFISSIEITGKNCTVASGGSSTSTSGTVDTATLPPSSSSNYEIRLKATVIDTRGAKTVVESSALTVYAYKPPKVTLRAYRTATSTSTTEDPAGTYVYITYTTAVGASVNGQNSITSTSTTPSGIASVDHKALAATSTQTYTVRATDAVGETTTVKVLIGTAKVPLSLYSTQDGSSVGVGLGEAAQPGKVLSSTLPLYLNDTTAVGTILTASSTKTSLSASSETTLCSLTLTKGKWVVIGQFRMQGGAAFQCSVGISTGSTQQTTAGYAQLPVTTNVGNISCSVQRIFDVTDPNTPTQVINLIGWHNYSSSRSMVSGQNSLTAICIA